MANFEKCLFPGMDQNQYRVLWIEHKDKINEETGRQRLELNFLIPKFEIESGQRLQPYYQADMPRVDLFKRLPTLSISYMIQMTHHLDRQLQRKRIFLKQ